MKSEGGWGETQGTKELKVGVKNKEGRKVSSSSLWHNDGRLKTEKRRLECKGHLLYENNSAKEKIKTVPTCVYASNYINTG